LHARRWLSIDVTHECPVDERHVRLAQGPDYTACAPVRGIRSGGGEERMEVQVQIRPLG
jgi:transglutaminase-like putative cysteine protease